MPPFSEEDLRGLSAAERESLLAVDDDDEDVAAELGAGAAHAAATASDGPGEAREARSDDGGEPDPDAEAGGAGAAGPADGQPQGGAASEEDDLPPVEPRRATPEDVSEQRRTLRAERAGALQQLLEGEITQDEFQEVEARVQDGLDALVRAEATDAARSQLQYDHMMAEYQGELRAARRELKEAGIDLEAEGLAFDRAVRLFAQDAGERGLADQPGNLAASKAALRDAVDLVLRRAGKAGAASAAAAAPAPAAPARRPAPADRSKLPPTLAAVPAAADASVTSEFAHLQGLEGPALERALARLTPEQQDRYLDA
ncbi:MAG: hypothetical protein J7556_22205 [Acidovorax sp.]|nr:hypothetical protein [Acidovorax sp.]